MSADLHAAIERLEAQLAEEEHAFRELERNVYGKRIAINTLCELIGEPPRYPGATAGGAAASTGAAPKRQSSSPASSTPSAMQIRADTFYGKRQQTAVREYLEMRKASGQGAATPREIFDALRSGGFQYDTKDEQIAMIGLRALLRKRTAFFHKLPNGSYGLTAWYPDAKRRKGLMEHIAENQGVDLGEDDISAADKISASDEEADIEAA